MRRRPVEGPFALIHRSGNTDNVHCLNRAAEAHGLHRGMAAADANAICPGLVVRPADLAQDAAALANLGRWIGRYAPLVARDGPDGLVADITGVPHLFGGEPALRADLHARLARCGLTLSSAIAETRGAARALACYGGGIIPEGMVRDEVAKLPVATLGIAPEVADGLARMGLRRIGNLVELPRAPLARRFGPGLVRRIDQVLGLQSEPVSPDAAEPWFGVRMSLPEPIGLEADVMTGLSRLLDRLCEMLALHERGARRLLLELHRVDREIARIEIGLARPMREPARIAKLFARGVADAEAGFGIEAMRLLAHVTEDLPAEQVGGANAPSQEDALADLFSRLGNRLGFDRVLRLLPATSKIPERSFLLAPAAYSSPEPPPAYHGPERPLMIFPPEAVTAAGFGQPGHPPARFTWRRMSFTTLRAEGPERIAPEWWFDDPAWRSGLRDYWRVETREGPRLWLFHTPQAAAAWSSQNWFAQGEFA